jgi:MFS family permease
MRARVVAVYTFAYYCALPIGTAVAGNLADVFGVRAVLLGMAVLTVAATAIVLLVYRPLLSIELDAAGVITVEGRPAVPAPPMPESSISGT